ncbi:MAG: hypothetical protein M5U28_10420 [Sandaracinaceae bacterium]|nr:hypothetical protein [Sandaracinaceae bacterium]
MTRTGSPTLPSGGASSGTMAMSSTTCGAGAASQRASSTRMWAVREKSATGSRSGSRLAAVTTECS